MIKCISTQWTYRNPKTNAVDIREDLG